MAEMLKRQNDIVTLKVELKARGEVIFTLQWHEDHALLGVTFWQDNQASFGLSSEFPVKRPDESNLHFPAAFIEALHAHWHINGIGHQCLWVHLVQPCGTLSFLPWEQLLVDLQIPVLMLPDFIFPPPQESFEQLDVVVCGSAPLQREKIDAGNDLIDTLQAIASGVDRPLRLHVFTDTDLSPLLNSIDLGCEVIAYSIDSTPLLTANGMTSIGQPGRSLQSPWLVWMRDALKTFSVDAVHFICHGHLSGLRGSLLFAQSPTQRSDDFLAGSVGAVELANFLIQIGAWATAFSAPTDNHSLLGLRVLADEIAQTLPGPMMMFDHNKAPYGVLEAGYRFVHSPYPQRPPYHEGGLYLYCQPYLLTRSFQAPTYAQRNLELQDLGRRYARNRAQIKTVLNTYALSDDVQSSQPLTRSKHLSAVTAATERAAEQIQLHYQKLIRDEVVPQKTALRDLSIAMETIQQFRQALGEVERERVGDEAGNPLADKGDAS